MGYDRLSARCLRPALLSLLLPAIGPLPSSQANAQEVGDSAGVRLIESRTPAWHHGEAWTVEKRPSVVIGTVTGEATQELGRVEDAVRLGDGRILVAEEEVHKVLIFSSRGRLLGSTGRRDSQGHPRPFPEEAAETVPWQVVDSSGRRLGSVPVPTELTVFQIGDDFLLGAAHCRACRPGGLRPGLAATAPCSSAEK